MINKIFDIISFYLNGEKLNINYLNESEPSYSIEPIGDRVVKKYLADKELREFTFDLLYLAPYGDDVNINTESLKKLSDIAQKIENHEDDSYEFFAAEMTSPPVIASVSLGLAKYRVRMTVTYAV